MVYSREFFHLLQSFFIFKISVQSNGIMNFAIFHMLIILVEGSGGERNLDYAEQNQDFLNEYLIVS